jgi:L-iditol 2-dehydrogenase
MKVAAVTGPRQSALVEQPEPTIRDNYVRIKILAAPLCTEVGQYRAGDKSDCLGHEAAGEVVETAQAGRVRVGDRVVVMPQNGCGMCDLCLAGEHIRCPTPRDPTAVTGSRFGRATLAQYCIQQDWLLYPVPDSVSIEHASLACCGLGPTFNAMQMMQVGPQDTVLISGLGAVGLGGVVNAVTRGARVIGLESHPWRANLARQLGASTVIDPSDADVIAQIRDLTEGRGADKSLEASSAETAPSLLLHATRIGGELTSIGWGGPMQARDVVARGITVRGAWHWNHLRDARAMRETLRATAPLLDTLITHQFPMSRIQDAWEQQMTGNCGKIILDPWS